MGVQARSRYLCVSCSHCCDCSVDQLFHRLFAVPLADHMVMQGVGKGVKTGERNRNK